MTKVNIFIALDRTEDNDLNVLSLKHEINAETIICTTVVLLHAYSFYGNSVHALSFDKAEELLKQKIIKYYFVPKDWNGKHRSYLGKHIPEFIPNRDIAINFAYQKLVEATSTQSLQSTLDHLYLKDHPIHEKMSFLYKVFSEGEVYYPQKLSLAEHKSIKLLKILNSHYNDVLKDQSILRNKYSYRTTENLCSKIIGLAFYYIYNFIEEELEKELQFSI